MNTDRQRTRIILIMILLLSIALIYCVGYIPNDAELGAIIRKHFQKL